MVSYGQEIEVNGTVSSEDGIPLPGASIIIEGTTIGTQTDFDGNFSFVVENGVTLVISFVGFKPQEVIASLIPFNIVLVEDAAELEEVIITAQGIKKSKKALGYAVSTISSEAIQNRPEADVARTLQGKVAGVRITASSGSSGEEASIRIRSSLSINQTNSPLIIVNNVAFGGDLIDLDPNDIKEISILKGLNASIFYGSEGRNGVILIQTKSGSGTIGEKKVTATFSQTTYVNEIANLPEYQNKYGQGSSGTFVPGNVGTWGPAFTDLDFVPHPYASQTTVFPEYEGVEVPYQAFPNNIKNFFNTAVSSVTSMNISTSQENTSFNISAGYTDEVGIIGNNDLKRFNLSIGGSAKLTDKLNISATLSYSTIKRSYLEDDGKDVFDRLLYFPRNLDIANLPYEDPVTGANAFYRNSLNPLWLINNTGLNDDTVRVFGTFNAGYKLNDNLTLSYRVGYDSDSKNEFDYSNKGGLDQYEFGFLNLDFEKEVIVDQTILLNSSYKLTDKIGFDAQIGISSKYSRFVGNFSDSDEQVVYGFLRPSNFSTTTASYYEQIENLAGVFGQFEFSYDNYLYLTFSGRNDWGSTVEPENRQVFYPGASFSFIPTSAFDFGSNAINYLKIRGAYGASSGYPSPYRTRTILNADTMRFVAADGTNVIINGSDSLFPNPNLKPEFHKEFEIGVEGKFFNNTVSLDASIYKRISEDQILEQALDPSTGYTDTFINAGRIDTKGIELDLGINIFKNEDFSWNFRNIFSAYETLVVDLPEDQIRLERRIYAIEGQPFGILYGSYALRDDQGNFLINPTNGELIISDEIGLDDRIIGNPAPDWTLTTINNLRYKGFTLSAQLEYTHGGEIFSDLVEDLMERGVTRDTENREGSFVLPGVYGDTGTGLSLLDANGQTIPNTIQLDGNSTAFSNYYNADDLSTFDASVFRIREISLAYRLDKKKYNKLPFESLTITLSGQNIFYHAPGFPKYTNIDPELQTNDGTAVPTTKRYALGISVSF